MNVDLAPHQLEALEKIHNGSIVKGGVGTGKSRTAVGYFFRDSGGSFKVNGEGVFKPFDTPRDLYIITTARKRDELDWEKEAALFGLSTHRENSISGVQVKVDSWNNLMKYINIENAFFIFDEQRLVGSGAWVKAFIRIAKANRWIILSATPGDTWLDYIPVFVANGFYKNRTEFVRTHVVWNNFSKFPKIDHYVEIKRLQYYRSKLLVEMPFNRHTVRHNVHVPVQYDSVLFDKAMKERWHVYEDRPLRDVSEMFAVMRKIVNSDYSRLGEVMRLSEKHPRLIIFYNFNYELEMLRTLANTLNIESAEWNGHKHQDVPEGDRWIYLVQYTAGAEAWNCVRTNALVMFSLNYSYKVNEQVRGRIDRMNTPYVDLYYYILKSVSPIDRAISKSLASKKSFNEKDFEISWPKTQI